jgi:hypothetical protein
MTKILILRSDEVLYDSVVRNPGAYGLSLHHELPQFPTVESSRGGPELRTCSADAPTLASPESTYAGSLNVRGRSFPVIFRN